MQESLTCKTKSLLDLMTKMGWMGFSWSDLVCIKTTSFWLKKHKQIVRFVKNYLVQAIHQFNRWFTESLMSKQLVGVDQTDLVGRRSNWPI